jgi:hypothetical protein
VDFANNDVDIGVGVNLHFEQGFDFIDVAG